MHERLRDWDHPQIQAVAARLTKEADGDPAAAEQLFLFIRDDSLFGLPPARDVALASQVLGFGVGCYNTKATPFQALCRAAGGVFVGIRWGRPDRSPIGSPAA
jgi:hypothetical protein